MFLPKVHGDSNTPDVQICNNRDSFTKNKFISDSHAYSVASEEVYVS